MKSSAICIQESGHVSLSCNPPVILHRSWSAIHIEHCVNGPSSSQLQRAISAPACLLVIGSIKKFSLYSPERCIVIRLHYYVWCCFSKFRSFTQRYQQMCCSNSNVKISAWWTLCPWTHEFLMFIRNPNLTFRL